MTRPQSSGPILRNALFGALAFTSLSVIAGGCLDRPVAPATPSVSARIVSPAKQNKVSKIDLLFMIDNSSSMADKQTILANVVPDLVRRLVDPVCINPLTGQLLGNRNANGSCNQGEPDFDPIRDIHIGIISSSLGGHGSTGVCDDPDPRKTFPHNDDHAHLLTRGPAAMMEPVVPTFMNEGFLNWNPDKMMGQAPNDIITPFQTLVTGVGQHGCGYEASLEAIYRFLIEPEPYQSIVKADPPAGAMPSPDMDTTLLKQRADFLRPDSLVAVMMITDENDCSVKDVECDSNGNCSSQGFYSILTNNLLGHGTSQCLTNPNDHCCLSCQQDQRSVPADCPNLAMDSECMKGTYAPAEDPANLRCWQQKKRYGADFLYSTQRYINGFKDSKIPNRRGIAVQNPLYDDLTTTCNKATGAGCSGERDKSLVFVAGVVGVPWQDIALDVTDLTKGYLSSTQIADMNLWAKILGTPFDPTKPFAAPIPPTDPHMIESIAPRAGLPPPGSPLNADPINGHEWDPSMSSPPNADLQYACIFPLPMTKTCTEQTDCDCFVPAGGNAAGPSNPLCQNGGMFSNVQRAAKGYPGTRELEVLKGLGEQAIVASICPSNVTNTNAVDYGYRPAIAALISRLRNALRGRCLPRQLAVTPDGSVPCVIVEAFYPPAGGGCDCSVGRQPVAGDDPVLTDQVRAQGTCFCAINQLKDTMTDNSKTVCESDPAPGGTVLPGWCYVDPSQATTPTARQDQCQIVRNCPATDRRIIRFVSPASEPRPGATAFIMCQEQSFPSSGGAPMDPCQ